MKWKVRTYAEWMALWNTRRKYKGTVGIGNGLRMYELNGVLYFHPNQYDTVLGVMTQDDIFTVRAEYDDLKTWKHKFIHLIGVNVYSHQRTKTMINTLKACEQGVSLYGERGVHGEPYPFVTGLQYRVGEHARCINKDEAVQKVKRLKPDVQHRVTQALAPLTAACKVINRLDGFDAAVESQWWTKAEQVRDKLRGLSLEQVTAEALSPQDVLDLGWSVTEGRWRLRWSRSEDEKKAALTRAVDNGLRLLREHYYERLDGYVIVTKPD